MVDNEWLCAMEPCLQLKRSPPHTGLTPETAKSASQHLTYLATEAIEDPVTQWFKLLISCYLSIPYYAMLRVHQRQVNSPIVKFYHNILILPYISL